MLKKQTFPFLSFLLLSFDELLVELFYDLADVAMR